MFVPVCISFWFDHSVQSVLPVFYNQFFLNKAKPSPHVLVVAGVSKYACETVGSIAVSGLVPPGTKG